MMDLEMRKVVVYFIVIAAVLVFLYYENNLITITTYKVKSSRLPVSFEGFRIAHISDLHAKSFGKNNKKLLEAIKSLNPEIIAMTGDLIDDKTRDFKDVTLLMENLGRIAPVYYVTGNNEWWSRRYFELESGLKDAGVNVLHNTSLSIKRKNDQIIIAGIDDPDSTYSNYSKRNQTNIINSSIKKAKTNISDTSFILMLSHRPEHLYTYAASKLDVVLTGHAHGGQARIPFIGGLIAPNQGLFPKLTSGAHRINNTTMIINRGLGNSVIPQRIFNRPEIGLIELDGE